tara:strand:- start:247 stop:942 length:696 start_codon:yes stop_codon:yes gene_type:complete
MVPEMIDRYTHIIPYMAASTNKVNERWLGQYPWRWLLSPFRPNGADVSKCLGYAIDNGAFVYGNRELPFDPAPFMRDVDRYGERADWVVIPDVLCDKDATLDQADRWIDVLDGLPLLIVAQDGMVEEDLKSFCSKGIGIFIGGSTEFKLEAIPWIAQLCNSHDVLCHVGRVNTARRMDICINGSAHSFDGSGMAIFEDTARLMTQKLIMLETDMFPRDFNTIKQKYIRSEQ